MSARLELRGLQKAFGGTPAVRDVSLALQPGEFVALLGPSGCGKSTTLALVAGFETPDAGEILVEGKRMNETAPGQRGIGIVFQDYGVFTRLTVRDNLGFGLEARGDGKSARHAAVADMAERLQLSPLLDRRGASLNASELQRVAIGRAAITRPSLLLLDEPMANLDSGLRERLRGELKRIQKSLGQTVLYVTHDQSEALALSDRIAVMDAGRLVQAGSPREIYERPRNRFVAEFIGEPPLNLITCAVHADASGTFISTAHHRNLRTAHAVPPGTYLLGLRPQHISISRQPAVGGAPAHVRHVENLGPEHVLHVEYGGEMVRAIAVPGTAAAGEPVQLSFDLRHALLIDPEKGDVIPRTVALEEAA